MAELIPVAVAVSVAVQTRLVAVADLAGHLLETVIAAVHSIVRAVVVVAVSPGLDPMAVVHMAQLVEAAALITTPHGNGTQTRY